LTGVPVDNNEALPALAGLFVWKMGVTVKKGLVNLG
jgi:hypothetical protein